MEGKFPYAVCRKDVDNNSILCQLCRCWVHKRCSGRSKQKEDRHKRELSRHRFK